MRLEAEGGARGVDGRHGRPDADKDAAQSSACRNYYVQLLKKLAADERR